MDRAGEIKKTQNKQSPNVFENNRLNVSSEYSHVVFGIMADHRFRRWSAKVRRPIGATAEQGRGADQQAASKRGASGSFRNCDNDIEEFRASGRQGGVMGSQQVASSIAISSNEQHAAAPRDSLGAFMAYEHSPVAHASDGPLSGLRFAVTDLFDVQGYPTGCGHPAFLKSANKAETHAPVVARLLDAGAEFAGKTLTDELAFNLTGINPFFGTPVNPKASNRLPGGAASGAAAATAADVVDFALVTDTDGAVRLPAAYCGLFGLRPSHGKVSLEGCMPLAATFDATAWMARKADVLAAVSKTLLKEDRVAIGRPKPTVISDALELMSPGPRMVFEDLVKRIGTVLGVIDQVALDPAGLEYWVKTYRACQAREMWSVHGGRIQQNRVQFGPGVRQRIERAAKVTTDRAMAVRETRTGLRARVDALLQHHGLMILPTTPDIAPLVKTPVRDLEADRDRMLAILCIASLAGVPQVTIPLGSFNGAPLGVSLLGPKGSDRALVAYAGKIADALGTAD